MQVDVILCNYQCYGVKCKNVKVGDQYVTISKVWDRSCNLYDSN